MKEVPAPTPEVGRPIEAGNYMPNNSQTKMGPFSVVSDGKCRTPNLRLFQQFLSQRQLSSRAQGQKHAKGSSSFLTVPIRNANTRSAYYRAIQQFLDWVERAGYQQLEDIEPITVAAYIETLQRQAAPPTVKQYMAAIRMLFSWR